MSDGFFVDRRVAVRARLATVFAFFTDSARFAAWWGPGSSIDARPGGEVHIRYPNGETAGGEVVEVVPGERVVFTYGYDAPGKPIARGGSTVTVTFRTVPDGTEVRLVHEVASAAIRDQHVPGWTFQLSSFANAGAAAEHADVPGLVSRWYAAWGAQDVAAALSGLVTEDVSFRDGFACVAGAGELAAHVAGVRHFMPGLTIAGEGEPAHCQGTVVSDWRVRGPDGQEVERGVNVFELAADGRIRAVTGLRRAS